MDIGLQLGDIIHFTETDERLRITMGEDVFIVEFADREQTGRSEMFSLSIVVKRHLGRELDDDEDVYEFFTYEGKTLRQIFEERNPLA